nr:hypothetical protein [Tanacetum cinerariifolium]
MPPKPDLSYIGLEEFTSKAVVKTFNAKTSEDVPNVIKNDNDVLIIKDWKSDDKDKSVPQPKIEKKTVKPSVAKVEFVKPKQQSQNDRKTIKNIEKSKQTVTVNTASPVSTAHPKTTMNAAKPRPKAVVNTARPKAVLNVVKGNVVYVVKALACWVWKPKIKILNHVSKYNSASITLKKYDYIDA